MSEKNPIARNEAKSLQLIEEYSDEIKNRVVVELAVRRGGSPAREGRVGGQRKNTKSGETPVRLGENPNSRQI